MTRILRLLACSLVLSSACGSLWHYDRTAIDTARRSTGCADVRITPLRSWSYQAEGCGEVTYWRCWNRTQTVRDVQCCRRVEREVATSVVSYDLDHPGGPYPETTLCQVNPS